MSKAKSQKEKHELYYIWATARRMGRLCKEWKIDFWKFVQIVGPKQEGCRLLQKDKQLPLSELNFEWVKIKQPSKDYTDHAAYMRAYRKNNPLIFKNLELKKHFGITLSQYNKLKESQNGVCAICGKPETIFDSKQQKLRELSVDHCHTTGKIRGLLCSHCNHAIGKFNDDVDLLQKAINYLTSSATCDSITTED